MATAPPDRFVAALRRIQGEIDHLSDQAGAHLQAEIATLRRQVLAALAALPAGAASMRLAALDRALDDLAQRFAERYAVAVAPVQVAAVEAGAALSARPLIEAGLLFHVPQLSRRQVEAARAFQALLIRNAATETVEAISRDLRLAILRGEGVPEVLGRVSGRLPTPGAFGTLATRAEAIVRTEVGRLQAVAAQSALEDAQRAVPDLQKQWRHSGNTGPYRRLGHIAAAGQVRDVGAAFRIQPAPGRAYEALQYPRDPAGSPANTVFCGCVSVPYRAEWRTALDAAEREQAEFLARRARSTAFQEAA
jgi:hypothetical protein